MIKFDSTLMTFTEVPDEISLCFNITQCPCHCQGCFEPWLQEDRGEILTAEVIEKYLKKYGKSISCVCFMGGDNDYNSLYQLSIALKFAHPGLKLAMYSGRTRMNDDMALVLDYYKVGPFIPIYGPMNLKSTNQKFWKKNNDEWEDITYKFQIKKE